MDNLDIAKGGQSSADDSPLTVGDTLHRHVSNWQQQYAQGNVANIPHDEVASAFNQWTSQAPPSQQEAAIEHAFSQASTAQRSDIGSTLINLFMQHGLNPQDAGVQTTNPNQMNPQDLARLTTYAQQKDPSTIQQLLSNPLVGMIISAALSYALQRFLGGTQNYNQPVPQAPQGGGGGLGDLFGQLFGGGSSQQATPTYPYGTQMPSQPSAPQGGGGLGDLLGNLFGGGSDNTTQNSPQGDDPLDVTHRRS
jgi:hypothetical protein